MIHRTRLLMITVVGINSAVLWAAEPDPSLKIVIMRHAEKGNGENLSCQGFNRSLKLPAVLEDKLGIPDYTYVPTLECDEATKHSRMFQTVTPFAVKHDLKINSGFAKDEVKKLARDVKMRTGKVLIVWEHKQINDLLGELGFAGQDEWPDEEFDRLLVITFTNGPDLSTQKQNIVPAAACPF